MLDDLYSSLGDGVCYFIPPKGWDVADPAKLQSRVKICFIGKGSKNLLPSLNLASEPIEIPMSAYIEMMKKYPNNKLETPSKEGTVVISLKAYVDIVKRECEQDPNTTWRDLGRFNTPMGEGRLTEREVKTEWGPSRQMQLIVIKDKTAYILTAGAHKEEFSLHYKAFDQALRSLTITNDLPACLPTDNRRNALRAMIKTLETNFQKTIAPKKTVREAFDEESFQKNTWLPFQQKIINDFTEMGPFWQILLLKEIQYKLLNSRFS